MSPWFKWTTYQVSKWTVVQVSKWTMYQNQTVVQLDCLIIDQAISSQLRVGQYPSHRAAQLSKASFKTHFQLVRSRSLPIKLAFTTCPKIVISCSKKLLSASENHSPGLLRATWLGGGPIIP